MIERDVAAISALQGRPAGLLRRLGAMVSDTLVVVGLLILTTFVIAPPLLNLLGKKALVPSEVGWIWTLLYWTLLLVIWGGYFVLLWSRTGQTVGMRAWRVQVQTTLGSIPSRRQAMQRLGWTMVPWIPGYVVLTLAERSSILWLRWVGWGLLLLGVAAVFSVFLTPTKRSWNDKMSDTKIIFLPKL